MQFLIHNVDVTFNEISYVHVSEGLMYVFRKNNACDVLNVNYKRIRILDMESEKECGYVVKCVDFDKNTLILHFSNGQLYQLNVHTGELVFFEDASFLVNKRYFTRENEVLTIEDCRMCKRYRQNIVGMEVFEKFTMICFENMMSFVDDQFNVLREFAPVDFDVEAFSADVKVSFKIGDSEKMLVGLNGKLFYIRNWVVLDSLDVENAHFVYLGNFLFVTTNNVYKVFDIENDKFVLKCKTTLHGKNINGVFVDNNKIFTYGEDSMLSLVEVNEKFNIYVKRIYEEKATVINEGVYKNSTEEFSHLVVDGNLMHFFSVGEKSKNKNVGNFNANEFGSEVLNSIENTSIETKLGELDVQKLFSFQSKHKITSVALGRNNSVVCYVSKNTAHLHDIKTKAKIISFENVVQVLGTNNEMYLVKFIKEKYVLERILEDNTVMQYDMEFESLPVFKHENILECGNKTYKIENNVVKEIECVDKEDQNVLNEIYGYNDIKIVRTDKVVENTGKKRKTNDIYVGMYILKAKELNEQNVLVVKANAWEFKTKRAY